MAGRPGRTAPRLTIIYWRDIPAQVKARAGRTRVSATLPDRFMVAVDAAATKAGKTTTDEYIAEWREVTRECSEDIEREVDEEAARITEAYPPDLVRSYVLNEGWAPSGVD